MGEHWECLEPAFASLSDRGVVEFVGPVVGQVEEAVSQARPSAIMVRMDPENLGLRLLHDSIWEQSSWPPVLLCIDHEGLETQELYENADDFVLVPYSAAEVEKRLCRLVRSKRPDVPHRLLRLGNITLDTVSYEVRVEGKRVNLAWMEFQLLKFLMENPGRIFTRDQLLSSVWGVDSFGGTRTVDVHIRRLRQKLGLQGNTHIRTVSNVGYGLIDA